LRGILTSEPSYDPTHLVSSISDSHAIFRPGEWVGRFMRVAAGIGADTIQFLIVDNTTTTLTVAGDLGLFGAGPGIGYSIVDQHLQDNSPAVNAGNNAQANLPATDAEGRPRILQGTVDLGRYEDDLTSAPVVVSIRRLDASPTHLAPLHYRVEFSENVSGVDAGTSSSTRRV